MANVAFEGGGWAVGWLALTAIYVDFTSGLWEITLVRLPGASSQKSCPVVPCAWVWVRVWLLLCWRYLLSSFSGSCKLTCIIQASVGKCGPSSSAHLKPGEDYYVLVALVPVKLWAHWAHKSTQCVSINKKFP